MNTIRKTALSNNKKNKTRSLLIMISIFLTTLLLTVICTYAYGMIKTQKANASLNYGSYYGICQAGTEQLQEMQRRFEFSKIGLTAGAGMLDSAQEAAILMTDENARDMLNLSSQLESGAFPAAENEIAAGEDFFESIGYARVRPGDEVALDYRPDLQQKYEARTFTVSGILKPQKGTAAKTAFQVYVSPAFYEAQYALEQRRYSALFQLADSVSITFDDAESVIEDLADKCGIPEKNVSVNSMYLIWHLDPGTETLSICGGIALLVIVFSVIVIYNIFQVGIAQKIQEYGKIRALGATKKQMRRLIRCEGLYLAVIGIPAGVTAGYLTAWGSFQWLMAQSERTTGMAQSGVSVFSLPVLLAAAFLALITVLLALRRPMKIVGGISPVEAVRYQESTKKAGAGIRRGKKNLSVFSLAVSNITADRRRSVMTVLTMGLSCVLFVVLANCVGNIDVEFDARKNVPYGQFQIELDYSLGDKAYPENNLDSILRSNPLNEELMEKIRGIGGVSQVRSADILLAQVNGRPESVAVYEEDTFNKEKQNGGAAGSLDYQDGTENDNIYYGWSYFLEDNGYALDQKVTMELSNGTDSCEAGGTLKGSFGSAAASWVITRGMYQRLGLSGGSCGWLWVDCKPEDAEAVRTELEQLLNGVEHIELTVYKDALRHSEQGARTLKLACYLFLAVIGLIGFMNLANTMIMNIITKKQEYGILQAVGMTNRQLNYSLQLQGLLFTAGTVLVAVLVGLPAGYRVFVYAKENAYFGMNVYHVPAVQIGIMAAAVAVLQLGLSFLLSRNLKKESLVERIRYQG